ncbi:MAG TPA: hypothetical protein VFO93_19200 [Hymenobacter sp.]|uniref:hypothetical protein n=1 Tax=Hymenobacter sp. TaxID=1898978 RepID=UPI002D7E8B66|nr:hypothetical protein [Hymenobacter sp.]HET9505680.1 hypothetical protein [Hymenobacter sp.]
MKLLIALLLNALLLAGLAVWLRAEYRRAAPGLRRWLLLALALRLAAGLLPHGPDSRYMSFWGEALTAQFWARPGAGWALWQGHQLHAGAQVLDMYQWSNTLFIIKILGLLNFASLGSAALNACYLSFFSFVGCWVLVRTLARLFPAPPVGAGVVAFLLWPSVVWWGSGVTKEALLLGSGAALTALVLSKLHDGLLGDWRARLGGWLLLGLLMWLHVRLRYFFALPLLGCLLALASSTLATRRGWLPAGWRWQLLALAAGLAGAGLLVVAVGGEPVSQAFVISQLWQNYLHGLVTSVGRPHLAYSTLLPTLGSMAEHFPVAAFQALVRPWLGESAAPLYVVAGLENLLLLGLLLRAAWRVACGLPGRLPAGLVLALLLYCLVLAGLIGLSTPNLGTLHRYRALMLPWLLWLSLQGGKEEMTREMKSK